MFGARLGTLSLFAEEWDIPPKNEIENQGFFQQAVFDDFSIKNPGFWQFLHPYTMKKNSGHMCKGDQSALNEAN